MIDMEYIRGFYPPYIAQNANFQKHMLKEYVELLALEWIARSPYAAKLIFIGGTNLRLIQGIDRFSEDLDFDCKGLFLTTSILQSFLRDQMSVWNAVMYIHRLNVITLEDDGIQFYNYFYNMTTMAINKFQNNPFQSEVVHALLRAAILAFCGNIKRNLPTTSLSPDTKTANIHFQRFLELLNGKGVKYRTVEAYANELCVSPKYISSICKKCSGKTANEWIRERILEEIRYYLQQTDLSNKEICDQIDFPNTSFFGKYVKEHFGMTPGEFRKSNCCK